MDTRRIGSQLISRKDVRVWFWDGSQEYKGDVVMLAEEGLLFHVRLKRPSERTLPDVRAQIAAVRRALEGKKVMVELSSPKAKGELKLRFLKIETVSEKKEAFAVLAAYEQPPDPAFLKALCEPVLQRAPKKP